MNSCILL